MRTIGDLLYNFHWIVPGEMARSAQAYAGFLGAFLRRHGIRSVINLRGHNPRFCWWRYETRVSARAGVAHIDIKLNSRNLPGRDILLGLLDAFDSAERPVLIKCSGGQDRTSFAAGLYLVHSLGWKGFSKAMRQFSAWPYLHWPKTQQRWMKCFLPFAQEDAGGKPISRWIAEDYTSERFMSWLEKREMQNTFRPIATRETSGKGKEAAARHGSYASGAGLSAAIEKRTRKTGSREEEGEE